MIIAHQAGQQLDDLGLVAVHLLARGLYRTGELVHLLITIADLEPHGGQVTLDDPELTAGLLPHLPSDSDGNRYTFDLRLAGRSTVRVHTGPGRGTRSDVYWTAATTSGSNTRDKATLRNDRDRVIDTESWGHRR
ncbi:lamin tail domain-containing protein [Streptomyces sp. NPDC058155]|uniref:lamin tail domain-containing protein n=1 Tax=Streptomyces sp. NPDC058155 TaxID=3346359 RepID=UPI0036EBAB6F